MYAVINIDIKLIMNLYITPLLNIYNHLVSLCPDRFKNLDYFEVVLYMVAFILLLISYISCNCFT